MRRATKTLWLIRHGSLPTTLDGRYIGQSAAPLSERGKTEAEAAGRYLSQFQFDAVYAGTLLRVQETVAEAAKHVPAFQNAIKDPRLNEIDFGDWSNMTFQEITEIAPDKAKEWSMGNDNFTFPGGEHLADFHRRVEHFLAEIAASDAKNIAVFSHGGVIMTSIAAIIGLPYTQTFSIRVERGALARLTLWEGTQGQLDMVCRPLEFETSEKSG